MKNGGLRELGGIEEGLCVYYFIILGLAFRWLIPL